jgi:uncharacterized membrane protein YqiK
MGLKKAFKSITKPIAKVVGKATDIVGITDIKGQKEDAARSQAMAESAKRENEVAIAKAKAEAEKDQRLLGQQMAARRRARRSGGGLLSDARLNAESGIQTLGGGNNLG